MALFLVEDRGWVTTEDLFFLEADYALDSLLVSGEPYHFFFFRDYVVLKVPEQDLVNAHRHHILVQERVFSWLDDLKSVEGVGRDATFSEEPGSFLVRRRMQLKHSWCPW